MSYSILRSLQPSRKDRESRNSTSYVELDHVVLPNRLQSAMVDARYIHECIVYVLLGWVRLFSELNLIIIFA